MLVSTTVTTACSSVVLTDFTGSIKFWHGEFNLSIEWIQRDVYPFKAGLEVSMGDDWLAMSCREVVMP